MNKNWMNSLSVFIKDNRKKNGISQATLADLTGMNTSYISRLEKGNSFQSVKIDFFIKVCDVFKLDEMEVLKQVGLK